MSWFTRLLSVGIGGLIAFAVAAALLPGPRTDPSPYPHDVLEMDRLMTERMAADVGRGMTVQMPGQGMWRRSGDPAYLRALEEHTREVDRMLGRTP